MKENIEAYFQVGTILGMSYPPAMYSKSGEGYEESLLKVLRDDFFSCIELTQITDDTLREKVKRLLAQSHMKICYGAPVSYTHLDVYKRQMLKEAHLLFDVTDVRETAILESKANAYAAVILPGVEELPSSTAEALEKSGAVIIGTGLTFRNSLSLIHI